MSNSDDFFEKLLGFLTNDRIEHPLCIHSTLTLMKANFGAVRSES